MNLFPPFLIANTTISVKPSPSIVWINHVHLGQLYLSNLSRDHQNSLGMDACLWLYICKLFHNWVFTEMEILYNLCILTSITICYWLKNFLSGLSFFRKLSKDLPANNPVIPFWVMIFLVTAQADGQPPCGTQDSTRKQRIKEHTQCHRKIFLEIRGSYFRYNY